MESLNRLGDGLPSEEVYASVEKELAGAFRGAALSLTGLFKVGKKATKKAYLAGKREALADVLEFLQTGLDQPAAHGAAATPLNIERFINYICETLKAEEEVEGEDEDGPSRAPAPPRPSVFPVRSTVSQPRPASPAPASPSRQPQPPVPHSPLAASHARPVPHRHEPLASSSSSAPPSPHHFNSFSNSTTSSNSSASTSMLPLAAALGMATSSSPGSGTVPSPITRLQARREREHRDKDRKGKTTSATSIRDRERLSLGNVVNVAAGENMLLGEGGSILGVGNLKRRWTTTPSLTNVIGTTAVSIDHDGYASSSTLDAGEEGEPSLSFDFVGAGDGAGVVFGETDHAMDEVMELTSKRRKL